MCQRAATPGTDQTPVEYLMKESWHPVPGYTGLYEVSDQGRVRSLDRIVTQRNRWGGMTTYPLKGRVLRPGSTKTGRLQVNLSKNNNSWVVSVHALVALAFLGPCPDGREIDHVNGDCRDNRLANLEYVTHQENQRRAYAMGKINPPRGNSRSAKTGRFKSSKAQSLLADAA